MTYDDIKKIFDKNCILSSATAKNTEKYLPESELEIKDFTAGEKIFSPDEQARRIGIIISGTASVLPVSSGENAMIKLLCSGDMFGIANLYSASLPFPSIISAKSTCRVLFINGNAFARLVENDKNTLKAYLTLLNNKIGYLNKKISTLTAGSTEKKLALYLAENECNGELNQTVSMSVLADMLNVGRASLYRAIDVLISDGLIIRDGKKIIILDKNALLNF